MKLRWSNAERTKGQPLLLRLDREFFIRTKRRKQELVGGRKPDSFGPRRPTTRAWLRHLRQAQAINPIHVARRFEQQYRIPGFRSYAHVAQFFGVSRPLVCYYMALLSLPPSFISWLGQQTDAAVLRRYCERRLRPITRLGDTAEQLRQLAEL